MKKREIKQRDFENVLKHFGRIEKDYVPEEAEDPFASDSSRVDRLKRIIARLSPVDRNIIILYSELSSTRSLAKVLHVSPNTALRQVKRVKEIILKEFNK